MAQSPISTITPDVQQEPDQQLAAQPGGVPPASRHAASTTITLDVHPEQGEQLMALHGQVPLVSRHAVARAAFQAGLRALAEHPGLLTQILIAQRRRRAASAHPGINE